MEENYIISDYCIIRNNRIVLNGEVVYTGNESSPGEFFTAVYRYFNIQLCQVF